MVADGRGTWMCDSSASSLEGTLLLRRLSGRSSRRTAEARLRGRPSGAGGRGLPALTLYHCAARRPLLTEAVGWMWLGEGRGWSL
jgi:hypothetical protein